MRYYIEYDYVLNTMSNPITKTYRKWFQSARAARREIRRLGYTPDKWVTTYPYFCVTARVRCRVVERNR